MTWFWSDDLARVLIEAGSVTPEQAASWISTPVAFRADGEPEEVAAALWEMHHRSSESAAA